MMRPSTGSKTVKFWSISRKFALVNNPAITQQKHTNWIKEVQATNGKYSTETQFDEFSKILLSGMISYNILALWYSIMVFKDLYLPVRLWLMEVVAVLKRNLWHCNHYVLPIRVLLLY